MIYIFWIIVMPLHTFVAVALFLFVCSGFRVSFLFRFLFFVMTWNSVVKWVGSGRGRSTLCQDDQLEIGRSWDRIWPINHGKIMEKTRFCDFVPPGLCHFPENSHTNGWSPCGVLSFECGGATRTHSSMAAPLRGRFAKGPVLNWVGLFGSQSWNPFVSLGNIFLVFLV